MKCIPNAMKSDDQGKSSSLILSIIFEIADLDPKLKAWVELKNCNTSNFYEYWHSEQIEHDDY